MDGLHRRDLRPGSSAHRTQPPRPRPLARRPWAGRPPGRPGRQQPPRPQQLPRRKRCHLPDRRAGPAQGTTGGVGVKPYYEDDAVTLYHGDCIEVMADLDAASVDTVLTDPPYSSGG